MPSHQEISHQEIKDQARVMAQSVLSNSPSFRSLERAEQMALYKDMVNTQYNQLAEQYGFLPQQSELATAMASGEKASDYINMQAHSVGGVAAAGGQELAATMKRVDFPGFVRDLLVGVFEANLDANDRQQQAFVRLVKELTKSYSEIIKTQVDAQDALGRLVQNDPRFKRKKIRVRDPRSSNNQAGNQAGNSAGNSAGSDLPTLVDDKGKEVKDAALQGAFQNMLMDMAKEYRALLREMLLMGVSRLVVERGVIRATANFKVDTRATQTLNEVADAAVTKSQGNQQSFRAGGFGFTGFAMGGFKRSSSISIEANSDLTVDSEKSITSSADVTGFVEIEFKSDYFKLDNFLQIMDLGKGQIPQGPPAKGAAQVPGRTTSQPLPEAQPQPTE